MNTPIQVVLVAMGLMLACGPVAASASESVPEKPGQAADLRKQARELMPPLPEKLPGSEKDIPALVELGRKLFFEKRLSVNETQSCNSCHAVDGHRAGVDNEPTSPGAFGKRGGRNSPTVLNAALHVAQFWDGRAATLEHQAKGPVLNPVEMAMPNEAEVLRRLKSEPGYREAFGKAFAHLAEPITYDNVAAAIAAFERTLITRDRFDDFLKGDDRALTATELSGLATFLSLGCTTCHNGPLLGGNAFHKVGLVNPYENKNDLGRYEVTKDDDDKYKFKVPSLRNIALTHPYFHDGSQNTLAQAVRKMGWLQLGKNLSNTETQSLVAFLGALSDKPRVAK